MRVCIVNEASQYTWKLYRTETVTVHSSKRVDRDTLMKKDNIPVLLWVHHVQVLLEDLEVLEALSLPEQTRRNWDEGNEWVSRTNDMSEEKRSMLLKKSTSKNKVEDKKKKLTGGPEAHCRGFKRWVRSQSNEWLVRQNKWRSTRRISGKREQEEINVYVNIHLKRGWRRNPSGDSSLAF